MKHPRPISIIWLLAITAIPCAAQDAPATPPVAEPELTLEALLQLARTNNPQLPQARAHHEAARQRLKALRARPNPTLLMIPATGGDREARDEEVILAQPLDLFGRRRALSEVAAAELRRAGAETSGAERALTVQVKNAAFDLYAAQESESLAAVQAETAGLFRAAAARRAELGDVPAIQVQRAELEVLRARNEHSKATAQRLAARATLNQLVAQPPQTPLRVVLPQLTLAAAASEEKPASTFDLVALREQLLPQALNNRSDLLAAQASLDARRAQATAARRERLPQVELQARRSSFFGREGSYAFRAVVSLPVFDFGSIRGESRAAYAEAEAQGAALAQLRSQTAAQIEQALLQLQQSRSSAESYRSGIVPISVELLRKTRIGYEQGASSYLEVLDAQRTLRQVQDEYLQALITMKTSETALESAIGAPLEAAVTGGQP